MSRGAGLRPELDLVIVTHDSALVIDTCLDAVAALPGSPNVIVVDNRSTDDTRVRLQRRGMKGLDAGANLGYAAAANLGARQGRAETLCFLNPDCVITPLAVEQGLAAVRADSRSCAVPTYRHHDGTVVSGRQKGYSRRKLLADVVVTAGATRWTKWLKRSGSHHDSRWYWPLGACLFVARPIFDALGGFDDSYFVYMEDVEFGMALQQAGGDVVALDCTLEHLSGMGSDVSIEQRIEMLDAARFQFAARHYGGAFATTLRLARSAARISMRAPMGRQHH